LRRNEDEFDLKADKVFISPTNNSLAESSFREAPNGPAREDLRRNSTIGSRTSSSSRTIGAEEKEVDPACLDQGIARVGSLSSQTFLIVLELELVLGSLKADEVLILRSGTTLSTL
jgi:hypothetical protein